MEHVISGLLTDFERGRMTRRQLIRSLALAASAGAVLAETPTVSAASPLRVTIVDHISYQVKDYARTRDFYADLFNMKVSSDDGTRCHLGIGDTKAFILPRNAPQNTTPPRVDHLSLTVDLTDVKALKAELERRGLDPKPDLDYSFMIKDPDGFNIQVSVTR